MVLLKIPQNSQENISLPGSLLAIIPQAGGLQPHSIPNLVQVFSRELCKMFKGCASDIFASLSKTEHL